jgi:hypothetical protein
MRGTVLLGGLVVVLAALFLLQPGCQTLNLTEAEHQHLYERNFHYDVRTMPDDIDLLLKADRPTRLSRWLVTY